MSSADPSASAAPAGRDGQYDTTNGGGGRHYAWVGGGGFNTPIGDSGTYLTWGGNFTAGGGLHFSRGFALIGEFSYFDNKLPGAFVAAGGGQTGNAHIFALTVDPVFDLFPKRTNSVFVVGGGGYYHKSTNFNVLGGYDFYGYPVYVTANSFSSNQGGFNAGFGLTHRLGGVYGDGQLKLFAEVRYTWIATPEIGQANGLGRTEIIPVTFGVRW
jgi:Outer membrane protein beta-barrel domain